MADLDPSSVQAAAAGSPAAQGALRVVTLVATDLENSTGLKQRLGDAAAGALIARHRALVYDLVNATDGEPGRVVNSAGDGFLLAFAAPTAALQFALGLQRAHGEDGALPAVRIGIHQGEVALDADGAPRDGVEVDTAARLGALARPGQILLSIGALRSAQAHLRTDADGRAIAWRVHGDFRLKGLQDPVTVGEAGVEGRSPLVPPRRDGPTVARRGRNLLASRALAVAASVAVLILGVLVPYLITRREADAELAGGEVAQSVTPSGDPSPVVQIRVAWGRAGRPGETLPRPSRPGPDDYLNLYLSTGQAGQLYVFRVQPDGSVTFQPPDYRDTGGACAALAGAPGQERLFGTYRLDDPPGAYCFVAILAREALPDLCGHVERHLVGAAPDRTVDAALGAALAAYAARDRILGQALFDYTVGGT